LFCGYTALRSRGLAQNITDIWQLRRRKKPKRKL
jgi:hypothetical protein